MGMLIARAIDQEKPMFLRLKIDAISMTSGWAAKSERQFAAAITVMAMELRMDGRDHLDLATGEVLRDPERFYGSDKRPSIGVAAHVFASPEPEKKCWLRYFKSHKSMDGVADSNATLHVDIAVDEVAFAELLANVRAGLYPKTISVGFEDRVKIEDNPIKFGWEPDGSGLIWDNSTDDRHNIQIFSARFNYEVKKTEGGRDELIAEPANTTDSSGNSFDELLAVAREISGNLSQIVKFVTVAGVAAIAGLLFKFL